MTEITSFCHSFKKDFTPRPQNPRQPVRCWSEKDVLDGKVVDAYVIIFRTRGCSWALSSGCTMCGYFNDSMLSAVSEKDVLAQFENALQGYKNEKIVKIFTSGSFLDPSEIPVPVQQQILTTLDNTAEKISVESRPEFITEKSVGAIQKNIPLKKFEVGIGLETSNDLVREKAINKGFTFQEFKKAAVLLKKHKAHVKTYVLLKPPFLTEKESLNDCINTAKDTSSCTDLLSLNPTNIQRHTVVEYLWKRNQYRPPWLWSIVEFLQQSTRITDAFVKCDVVGGGSTRGPHNCGVCDTKVLHAIEEFSLTQKKDVFNGLSCSCQEQWRDQLDLESISFGSLVDFTRWNP
ncbi:MAG TPA: archaeosine biosynthesis radical SAM protein RaSEA [Candidatus Thermoplasmatota archaeon]|nr:archaeosine biosynthesis radical SAM protein RaSEA [Candidatus Thermoplasmatota archaeon]